MAEQVEPPRFLQEFVDGRRGWALEQRHDGGWLAKRRIEMPAGWATSVIWLMPGLQQPHTDQYWTATVVDETGVNARVDGRFDEVVTELRQFERTMLLLAQLTQCTKREQAIELVAPVRGRQLEFLRQAAGVSRGPAQQMRNRIVQQACGFRLDHQAITNGGR